MKEQLLALLTQHIGEYISGASVSRQLGVTRAAVWKAVQALQKDGFEIEAAPRRGYRLTAAPDRLTPGSILPRLQNDHRDSLLCFPTITSTNDRAKTLAVPDRSQNYYLAAEEQTGGRGRRGRSFYSPAGLGLYLTGLYFPDISPLRASRFTAYAAVAVCRAVEEVCGFAPVIKWPNDILWEGRKLCGILTEMALESESGAIQYMLTGMGINTGQAPEDFPEDIRDIAASLKMATGTAPRRDTLCAALINALDDAYAGFLSEDPAFLAYYQARCATLGHAVNILTGDQVTPAFAESLSDDFGLTVRYEDGRRETVYAGEVSLRAREV
ncbi:MAG: biotin--[acetyl-CoA-carboxylase] ligase [Lachnospiraceae bacterium]|nr:biotin--[acetyl-CoA-carboxylase] ligase [Lachnospiraceae bacterium]